MAIKGRVMMISEHASPLASIGGIDAGGQNVYVDKLSRELAKKGYEVDVFTRRDEPEMPQVVDCLNGVRVINIDAGRTEYVAKEEMLPLMKKFRQGVVKFIRRQSAAYDLIHANFFMSALVGMEIKRLIGTPLVVTFHALGKIRKKFQGQKDKFPQERIDIEKRAIEEADAIIAECPQDKNDLVKLYGAEESKIRMIPCGFDPEELYPVNRLLARKVLGWDFKRKTILQLGRIVPRKGIDNVIRAVAILKKNYDLKAKLYIVGGETNGKPDEEIVRLEEIAKSSGVAEEVVFLGKKERHELKFYYSAADVFTTTPWYEAFGITPVEAMACGTPVVGAKVGGIKYTLAGGKCGVLVEPKNPQSLAEGLYRVLANPKEAAKLAAAGRSRVNRHFRWSTIARKMVKVYQEVINRQYQTNTKSGVGLGWRPNLRRVI